MTGIPFMVGLFRAGLTGSWLTCLKQVPHSSRITQTNQEIEQLSDISDIRLIRLLL